MSTVLTLDISQTKNEEIWIIWVCVTFLADLGAGPFISLCLSSLSELYFSWFIHLYFILLKVGCFCLFIVLVVWCGVVFFVCGFVSLFCLGVFSFGFGGVFCWWLLWWGFFGGCFVFVFFSLDVNVIVILSNICTNLYSLASSHMVQC